MTLDSNAYMVTKVLTVSNREVILYLYEGAAGFLQRAVEARKRGDETECCESLDRVSSIMIELSSCLDYNRNGSLAIRLDSIYNYMIESLGMSNRQHDLEAIETCLSILAILSDAWRQAIASESGVEVGGHEPSLEISA